MMLPGGSATKGVVLAENLIRFGFTVDDTRLLMRLMLNITDPELEPSADYFYQRLATGLSNKQMRDVVKDTQAKREARELANKEREVEFDIAVRDELKGKSPDELMEIIGENIRKRRVEPNPNQRAALDKYNASIERAQKDLLTESD